MAYLLEMLYCKLPTDLTAIIPGKCEKYIHCVPSQNIQFLSGLEVYHRGSVCGDWLPGTTAATYRARKEVLKRAGHKLCWPLTLTTAVVVVLIRSIAFYAVFLGNMVSAVFKEIHTEKCKKRLIYFSFGCSCSWKRCKTPYLPTAHSFENAAGEHSWTKLKELCGPPLSWEASLLFDLTSFTFFSFFLLLSK